jgi:hypothetical protein
MPTADPQRDDLTLRTRVLMEVLSGTLVLVYAPGAQNFSEPRTPIRANSRRMRRLVASHGPRAADAGRRSLITAIADCARSADRVPRIFFTGRSIFRFQWSVESSAQGAKTLVNATRVQ